ncbi:MAG: hypothetical protein ACYTAO_20465 [Planctomycetota bacterium]|jgi:hypothetical protein
MASPQQGQDVESILLLMFINISYVARKINKNSEKTTKNQLLLIVWLSLSGQQRAWPLLMHYPTPRQAAMIWSAFLTETDISMTISCAISSVRRQIEN